MVMKNDSSVLHPAFTSMEMDGEESGKKCREQVKLE